MSNGPKLSFSSSLLRARVEFTKSDTAGSELPPEDIMLRARAKMDSILKRGAICHYSLYEDTLIETWARLRDSEEADSKNIAVTIAAGCPEIKGVTVAPPESAKVLFSVSIKTPSEVLKKWQFHWFKLAVEEKLSEIGIEEISNIAQLHGAFVRAQQGEKIENLLITEIPPDTSEKPYSVVANKSRMEIGIVIRQVKALNNKQIRDGMLNLVNQAIKQLSAYGASYRVLKAEFLTSLQNALNGPECLGINLPMTVLAAIGNEVEQSGNEKPRSVKPSADFSNEPQLEFEVSSDNMEATIINFDKGFYHNEDFQLNIDWIHRQLKKAGIKIHMRSDVQKGLSTAILAKKDLNGLLAAMGERPRGGTKPYLHPVYKSLEGRTSINLDEDTVDLRAIQQRNIVKEGQLVAEIRYKFKAKSGMDIFGEVVPPEEDEEFEVNIGEGIRHDEYDKFFALTDGIPTVDENCVSLSKILFHEGDVNLRSGNIVFDGPVEIDGSIDSGSTVESTGDIIIKGTVRGGYIKAGGNITVEGGIITGEKGRVQARGDIFAEFVENSRIYCGGDITVAKALLNSEVIAGGFVKSASPTGVIAGGHIACRESLYAGILGYKEGKTTNLNVGVDWRAELAVRIREGRIEKIKIVNAKDRQELRELVKKSKAQTTKKHVDMKAELQERLQKQRNILDKLNEQLVKAKAMLSYNPDCKVYVKDLLVSNVDVQISGQKVLVPHDVKSVAIVGKRKKGTHILPLEEVLAEEAEGGDNAA